MSVNTEKYENNSRLNQIRREYWRNRHAYKTACEAKDIPAKNFFFGQMAKWRARIKHEINGTKPPERFIADRQITVAGIPCGVVIQSYNPPRDWKQHTFPGAGPGDCDPPEPEEVSFFLIDLRGYPAPWLESKINEHELEQRVLEAM